MKKKFLAVIIVWMVLFVGCSEGHRRHRGHPVMRRPVRPYYGQVCLSVHRGGPRIVISRHPSYTIRKGSYGSRRGSYGKSGGKGHGYGRGRGK